VADSICYWGNAISNRIIHHFGYFVIAGDFGTHLNGIAVIN